MPSPGYRHRLVDDRLERALAAFPAVMLVGPRACGKTTTAERHARSVLRLDVPMQAAVVRASPDAAVDVAERPLLIDEWQVVPEIVGAVKRAVDGGAPPGSFLLTGSVAAGIEHDAWPGTGRLLQMTMGPLTRAELSGPLEAGFIDGLVDGMVPEAGIRPDAPGLTDYIARALEGGFPTPVLRLPEERRAEWYRSYVEDVARRDVTATVQRLDPDRIRAYMEAYALSSAGVCDHKTIYDAAGINRRTADGYEAVLERLFVIQRVPAWTGGRLARLVHQPKRMMVDTGVWAAAARVGARDILRDGNLLGRLLETFVHSQVAALAQRHPEVRIFHLRTEQGRREVDLILDLGGGRIVGIEVKAGGAPDATDARHLLRLRDDLGNDFVAGVVLHTGPGTYPIGDRVHAVPIAALWT